MNKLPKSGTLWFCVLAALLVSAGVVPTIWQWSWLNYSSPETESNSTTLRNVGFIFAGVLALVFGVWRGLIAERQANAAQSQSETALRQAETAQQSLLNERYQRGAEMLASSVLAVRMGGIYALNRLAEEHPKQYHIQIMELFCSFVRDPAKHEEIGLPLGSNEEPDEQERTLRTDVQTAMHLIGSRDLTRLSLEKSEQFRLYLREANISRLQLQAGNLSSARLTKANLSGAILPDADLSAARLRKANLSGAQLRRANLSDATLWGTDLSGAILWNTNLSGTDLCGRDANSPNYGAPVRGLTQAQLDQARADPPNIPPKLEGVFDSETGKPLVWRGKPLESEY